MPAKNELVLAAFGQLNRDKNFRIMTKIVSNGTKTSVRKVAYTKDAIPHIERLKKNHKKLSDAVSSLDGIRIVDIVATGTDFVEFEYIKGQNLEHETFKHIITGNYDEAMNAIDRIFSLVDNLSSQRAANEAKAVKNINDAYQLPSSSATYANPGIIDLNLDNFMLSHAGELVAFDYEWMFDQPIASDFIKTRLLYTFFARRGEAFAFLPNKHRTFKTIWEGEAQALIPAEIHSKYSTLLTKQAMRKYWQAEDIFQKSVNQHRLNTAPSNYENFKSEELTSPRLTFPEIEELRRNSYESQLAHARQSNEELLAHTQNIEKELAHIKSSTAYRAARKMGDTKNKILKKKPRVQ